jgi:hypothetical protein
LTVNVAVELPATIAIFAGKVAFVELLASLTDRPPVGAAPVKVTVPVDDDPPVTLEGFRLTD